MRKYLRFSLKLLVLAAMPLFAQDGEFEIPSPSGPIDFFTDATPPDDWLENEASDPNGRPVERQRFVELRGTLIDRQLDPSRPTPFEFRMVFMDGVVHRVVIESVEDVVRDSITLRHVIGRIKSDELSRINLVVTGGQIQGTVHSDELVAEMRPVDTTISVIQLLNPTRFPRERKPRVAHRRPDFVVTDPPDFEELVFIGNDFTGTEPYDGKPYSDVSYEPPEIGVLVVVSADIHSIDCDTASLAQAAITYQGALDLAFAGYATSRVDFRCTTQVEVWSTLEGARNFIETDTDVKLWRKQVAADLVTLLVKNGLGYCGYAMYPDYPLYPIDTYADQYALKAAFAVVDEACALGQSSFAHEIGHLHGMKHERFNEQGGVSNFCGYGYPVMRGNTPVELTIMSYDDYCDFVGVTCQRTTYYSIPRKKSGGLFGWLSNLLHKCFGKTKGKSCASTTPGHLNRPASDTMQIIDAAGLVATYSDKL